MSNELVQARKSVESILANLGVTRVVYVDDANNENTVEVEDVIAASQTLDATVLLAEFPELESIPNDPDVLINRIRTLWTQLHPTVRLERGQAVIIAARQHDQSSTDDVADKSILSELIPAAALISMSPAQWEAQRDNLLKESNGSRTLFLFDRDFSGTGGDAEGGIKIIASLLASNNIEHLLCGLLTHTVTPETQPVQWVQLSEEHGIPRDRFIVIPKLHLSRAPLLFAQTLKFVALSPDFSELKRVTKEIIAASATNAAERVEKVSIYDLDHIVFQVSADEGLWEPDMLFRLHAMFHQMESRRMAHVGGTLESIAARLRKVSCVPTGSSPFPTPDSAWQLQREELYEPEEHLNKNHLPLELGDIFEHVGGNSNKKYILLAQPCDLMVRSDGKRHPELARIPLAEVTDVTNKEKLPYASEEIPYFDTVPMRRWVVKFKAIHLTHSCILDLCVFNQDGSARLQLNGNAPLGIRPAWMMRHKIINRYWNRIFRKVMPLAVKDDDIQAVREIKTECARSVTSLLLDDDPFKGDMAEVDGAHFISFNLKRVGRLCRARSIGLLMSYSSTLGRPAYDRDFGRA